GGVVEGRLVGHAGRRGFVEAAHRAEFGGGGEAGERGAQVQPPVADVAAKGEANRTGRRVAHGWSAACAGAPRTTASAIRATMRICATSWTRTISAPPAIASV